MKRDSENPPPHNRPSNIPPAKGFDKYRSYKLMIGRNRRKLISGKILPVTTRFADEEYYEKLKALAEEENLKRKSYEALSEEEKSQHPELGLEGHEENYKLWELTKDFLENVTGKSAEELRELGLDNPREIDEMAVRIENAIARSMPFLNGITEERKTQLRELSDKANIFYDHYIQYLPESTQALRWGTTLTNVDNSVGQLALKFITSRDPRLRHHSKTKLLLMLHLGFITNNKNKGVGFYESLSFLTNFITRSVAYCGKNDERGCAKTKFLKTTHSTGIKKTDNFSIHDSEKEYALKDGERCQKIDLRQALVTNENGEERLIDFVLESRQKDSNSLAEKGLRSKTGIIKDHHGIKFVCRTSEDVRSFEKLLIDKLQKEYFETLVLEYGKVKNRQISAEQSCDNYSKQLAELSEKKGSGDETEEDEIKFNKLIEKLDTAKKTRKEALEDQEKIEKMLEEKDKCIIIEYSYKKEKEDENGNVMKDPKGDPIQETIKVKSFNAKEALDNLHDSLDKGQHAGASKGSSRFFKVRKYYIDYRYPDFRSKKIMSFEWQFQLFDGYVDSQTRQNVNEDEFHVNRAFDDGLMELLAPPDVYPDIDLKRAKEDRLREIRNRVEDTLAHTRKGRRKLMQQRKNTKKNN